MRPGQATISGLSLGVWPAAVVVAGGQTQTVVLEVTGAAKASQGPLTISTSQVPGVLQAGVSPATLTGPGRTYLTLTAAPHPAAARHSLTVTVQDEQGQRLQRSVPVHVVTR